MMEMPEELKGLVEELHRENAAAHLETRRHFDAAAEGMKTEVQIVAEAVLQLDEKAAREIKSLRAEVRQGFSDNQAMIKDVGRRIRTLEKSTLDP
jgi:predicted ATPase